MFVNVGFENDCFTIVQAGSVEEAELWARWEFGNRNVSSATEATDEVVDWYKAWGGVIHEANNILALFTDEQIHAEAVRRRYEYDEKGGPLWEIERIVND